MKGTGRKELLAQDAQARRAACEEFAHPVVLEAGAGTGKTTVLVARVITWCIGPGWEKARQGLREEATNAGDDSPPGPEAIAGRVLERVTAITFTERAASEMAERVAAALATILDGEDIVGLPLEDLAVRGRERLTRASALMASLDRLPVGTIHSFCRRILAAYPIEAHIDPGFDIDADGSAVRSIVEETLSDRMRIAYGDPGDEDFLTLATSGIGPTDLAEALEILVREGVPAEALDGDPYSEERVLAARDRLKSLVDSAVGLVRGPLEEASSGRLKKALQTLDALASLNSALPHTRTAGDLAALAGGEEIQSILDRLKKWKGGDLTGAEETCFDSFLPELALACGELHASLTHLQSLGTEIMAPARRALNTLLAETTRRLRARGIETFSALLRDARDLVRENEGIRRRVRASIDQLLVDEFQDTDPIQSDLVDMIALDGEGHKGPGLFIVGDPKQSIYGWRDADLAAYDGFVRRACSKGGEKHILYVNYRSAPAILAEVERIMRPVMVESPGVQPPFEPLIPSEQNRHVEGCRAGGRRPVEYWVSWDRESEKKSGPKTATDRAREIEATAIARDLLDLHKGGDLLWSDAAILMRTTTAQDAYLQALRTAGIPYAVEGDRSYYLRREIIDAASFLGAIVDPNDHVALLGFLRSPIAGLPDAALIPLWRLGFPGLLTRLRGPDPAILEEINGHIEAVEAGLPPGLPGLDRIEGWGKSLGAAIEALGHLRRSLREDPADLFVERMRALLLPEGTEAARFPGAHRLANLDRFFRRLLDALVSGPAGPRAFVRELRAGVTGAREEEEGALADETLDAVRILSIHRAKGLDFNHVYLTGLQAEHRGGGAGPRAEAAEIEGTWELQLFGARSIGFDGVIARRARTEAAEMVRTLYVAATRPRVRLVLAGRWPEAPRREGLPEAAKSHMALLEMRSDDPSAFLQHFGNAGEERPVIADEGVDVRWVLPDPEPVAQHRREGKAPEKVVDIGQVRREMEHLAGKRREMEARMNRPLTAAASETSHEALREALEAADGESAATSGETALASRPGLTRDVAMAVGSAVHRVLETFDLDNDTDEELLRQRGMLSGTLEGMIDAGKLGVAVESAEAILDGLQGSKVIARLRDVSPGIVAREMPILLAGDEAEGPVGAIVGTIDLLYKDPHTGGFVVADYKTDQLADDAELEARARAYRDQGVKYLQAVRVGLGLDVDPRFELWFLCADRIVPMDQT